MYCLLFHGCASLGIERVVLWLVMRTDSYGLGLVWFGLGYRNESYGQ